MRRARPGKDTCCTVVCTIHVPVADNAAGRNRSIIDEGARSTTACQAYKRTGGLLERSAELINVQAWLRQTVGSGRVASLVEVTDGEIAISVAEAPIHRQIA